MEPGIPMTLSSTVLPLAAYAVAFQTILYVALPRRLRVLLAPVVTGVTGAAVTLAAAIIFGGHRLGLGAADPGQVVFWGVATVAATAMLGLVMMGPRFRSALADPRLAALSRPQAAFQILVRIPVFTALIEEAFFRGLLHAALVALYPIEVAMILGAGLFGLWHIGPGIDQAGSAGPRRTATHTALTVILTSAAGLFLVWLRVETGSIWAPAAVHAGLNMTLAVFARFAASRSTTPIT
jgi:membrane protease YdiL (CAAX protease family)